MLTCTSCQHENIDGTQFCEMCGEELPAQSAPAPGENLVACPGCGHNNPEENLACEACGADLKPGTATVSVPGTPAASQAIPVANTPVVQTSPFDDPAPANAAAPVSATPIAAPDTAPIAVSSPALAPGKLKLVVEQGQSVGAQFVLGDAEMLVGREDEDEEIYPDIDLSDQDAGYVHRKHATLAFSDGGLTVTHLGGANKTRLNNKPLADNTPTPVNPGDKIGFGKVVVRVLPV